MSRVQYVKRVFIINEQQYIQSQGIKPHGNTKCHTLVDIYFELFMLADCSINREFYERLLEVVKFLW